MREEHSIREGLEIFADQPYKREIIEGVGAPGPGRLGVEEELAGRGCRGRGSEHLPQPAARPGGRAGFRRPVPGTARALHQKAGPFQIDQAGRRLLAGRRAPSPAAAHLRHGVGVGGRAGGVPRARAGSRAARPPASGHRARPVPFPARDRQRAGRFPSQGGPGAQGRWRTTPARSTSATATSSCTRRTWRSPPFSRYRATWAGTPRACTPPWKWKGPLITPSP